LGVNQNALEKEIKQLKQDIMTKEKVATMEESPFHYEMLTHRNRKSKDQKTTRRLSLVGNNNGSPPRKQQKISNIQGFGIQALHEHPENK